jgi:hypothetical protein
VHNDESEDEEEDDEADSSLADRVVTSDSVASIDGMQPMSRLTLSAGQTLSLSSTLTRPQKVVDLDSDEDNEEGRDDSNRDKDVAVDSEASDEEGSDSSVLNGSGEVVTVDASAVHRVSVSSSDSNDSPKASPTASKKSADWKPVSLLGGAKRKLDQTATSSPAVSTTSNSVKKGGSWHATPPPRDGGCSDSDESAVVFIGRNPAPVVVKQQPK